MPNHSSMCSAIPFIPLTSSSAIDQQPMHLETA